MGFLGETEIKKEISFLTPLFYFLKQIKNGLCITSHSQTKMLFVRYQHNCFGANVLMEDCPWPAQVDMGWGAPLQRDCH